VKEGGKKKCNFCIWIDDENLPHFAPTNDFEAIAYSLREEWKKWVEEKIDQGDFRSLVLKLEKKGSRVINLSEMEEKMKAQ
jgi:chemotaxis regulatin CheY-phosphate phosphatase CheZ